MYCNVWYEGISRISQWSDTGPSWPSCLTTLGKHDGEQPFLLFSSPEHKVLMVSFCDRPMSVVRRRSCVIHNFFKHLLLNHWASLNETWQGCSLGEALPKLFKRLNSTHKSGCHGNQKEKK